MSSGTSTETSGHEPDPPIAHDQSLQPWQFFVLAALMAATVVTYFVRHNGLTPVILVTVLMGTAALVGLASLRMLLPLFTAPDDRTVMVGDRTRAALDREKTLTLRAIKELEFDHAMGKVSAEDFRDMGGRLRARAMRLMRQLDAGGGYRDRIERDLVKRLGEGTAKADAKTRGAASATAVADDARLCASCSTPNDIDAKFCKACGARL